MCVCYNCIFFFDGCQRNRLTRFLKVIKFEMVEKGAIAPVTISLVVSILYFALNIFIYVLKEYWLTY